jgi:hypothetical protein
MHTGSEESPNRTPSFPEAMDIPQTLDMMKMPMHLKPIWRASFPHHTASAQKSEVVHTNRPLLDLNLVIANDEIREEIASIEDQWSCYCEPVRTVTDLLRSKSRSLNKIAVIGNTAKGNSLIRLIVPKQSQVKDIL